ncbi:MAG: putative Monoheme cytochrome c [Candidatus Nitrospira kreftii]|uniref:Putative Monoheme cytochrome c n=1 Tax=Candidatus Nitrospira kreftii TaxID=2652173 RepID=A0A7S8FG78_9BACT|nr:MAG: putative Monoheme cytochrome c [Candidatus Nitrospira kreftii]
MGALGKPIILMVAMYIFLKFVLPYIPGSAPLPSSLIFLYLLLTAAGIVIFETLSGESKEAFWGPMQRFLTGENIGGLQTLRYGVLVLFPLLVGWQTYGSTASSDAPPAESRTIHPAPPGEYTGLSNPVPKTPENIMQGKGFYAAFCSPCHGGNFDGKGPAARGYNPPPANFADPTTIAMLQESYLFWRIKKGGIGLPIEGAPWKSAMPRWELELPDEWIWKIIMGEYDGAHQSPRTWE